MIIIILGQHKDTFEKKVFKTIYNLQSFFKHKNCSSIFQLQNTKSYPERGYFSPGNIQDKDNVYI